MQLDLVSFLVGLMIIPITYLFALKILLNPKLILSSYIFVIALGIFGLTQIKNTTNGKPNFYLFLFCPLYSLILFRILLYFFQLKFHRNPKALQRRSIKETIMNNSNELAWDRLFGIVFLILSVCLPFALLAFYP